MLTWLQSDSVIIMIMIMNIVKGKTERLITSLYQLINQLAIIIATIYVCINGTAKYTQCRNTIKVQWQIILVFNSTVKETSLVVGSIGSMQVRQSMNDGGVW